MSTPETMDQRPIGERRRRRLSKQVREDPPPPPMTRREMKARGILLTSELPVVEEPPDWQARSGAAAAADRSTATRSGAQRALSATEETVTGEFQALDAVAHVATGRRGRRATTPPAPLAPPPGEGDESEGGPEEQPPIEGAEATPAPDTEGEPTPEEGPELQAAPESAPEEGPEGEPTPEEGPELQAAPEEGPEGEPTPEEGPELDPAPESAPEGGPEGEPTPEEGPELEPAPEAGPEGGPEGEPTPEEGPELQAAPEPEPTAEEAAPSSGVPKRRNLRDKQRMATASAEESPGERTSTLRRPVVRTPLTARGVRTVDESGEITGVQPAVPAVPAAPPPVAWAPVAAPAGVPPQPALPPLEEWTTSPTNWDSAVSMPAVVLGIEDSPEPPTGDQPITPPRASLVGTAPSGAEAPDAEPVDSEGRSTVEAGEAPSPQTEVEPVVRRAAEGMASSRTPSKADAGAPYPTRRSIARSRTGAPAVEGGEPSTEAEAPAAGRPRWLTIVLLVVAGLALGALVYLIASGELGALFADAGPSTWPGAVAFAGVAAVPRVRRGPRGR